MKKLVCGVGNNDADYAVNPRINGKRGMCPAYQAWRNRKLKIAAELKSKMDDIDVRIYPRIIEIISNSK